ncbi:hypothetical protein LOK49_LG11G00087 [Camellia lanceoleosa]|uniref:Uncharacterized protein n=1 Tax=Camellia lanceoleosa TaxID=1840588 RepID=A0ACC0FXH8_9ERIC|nr:hypothetical protein LOK49_LG11G00087 [Camellia lanceoleosa]
MMALKNPNTIINLSSKPHNHIICLLDKCKNMRVLKQIHAQIIKEEDSFETPLEVSKLVSFCAVSPHGNLDYAKTIFAQQQNPSVELYNSLIRGFSSTKHPLQSLLLYQKMLCSGLKPNNFTYPFVIKACTESSMVKYGILVHTHVVKNGLESDSYIQSSLIHLYASGKDLNAAKKLFDMCSELDLVSWNAMIDGYVKSGEMDLAQAVFDRMAVRDVISWNTMINGYGILGRIEDAKRLFDDMPKRNVVSWNSMLAGYVKCGNVEDAFDLFSKMPYRDVVSWNAMLACYAHSGKSNEALALFDEMQALAVKPTEATMVGERVGKHLINLQPQHSGRYILLSNIYAAAKRWDDARKVRNLMKAKGVSKVPGVSVIELKGIIHRFVAGDWSHPESNNIYEKLWEISTRLKTTSGYSPDTEQVLLDIEEEEKENTLSVHSEKLAIAYGFIHLGPEEAIRIVKNLRVCRDCHYVIKLISIIYGREIIVRDRNRFHHFRDGGCSCLDFW